MATRHIWFAAVSTKGLFAGEPIELTWTDQDEFDHWVNYDYDTYETLDNLGSKDRLVEKSEDRVMFASRSRDEVKRFILGAEAVMYILRRITNSS